MIKYNDRFSIDSDPHNWILLETYKTKSKEGNPIDKVKKTYHPSMSHCIKTLTDLECKECESLEEVVRLVNAHNKKAQDIFDAVREEKVG